DGDTARQLDNLQPAYNLEDLFACTGHSKSRQIFSVFVSPFAEFYDDFIGHIVWWLGLRLGSILRTGRNIQNQENKYKDQQETNPLDHESLLNMPCGFGISQCCIPWFVCLRRRPFCMFLI